jgi:hypothetical protein
MNRRHVRFVRSHSEWTLAKCFGHGNYATRKLAYLKAWNALTATEQRKWARWLREKHRIRLVLSRPFARIAW